IVIPPAIFFYYSTLFDSRFKTLQQNRFNEKTGIGAPPKYRNMGPCCSARKSKKKNKTSNLN
ncbi:hypothetical protein FVD52_12050, partial [Enterococcus faecium]|nr:hypothetical protein [Enterococcus faecium]